MYKDFGSDWAGEVVNTTVMVVICGVLSLSSKVHVIYNHFQCFIRAGNLCCVGSFYSWGGSSAPKFFLQDNWLFPNNGIIF